MTGNCDRRFDTEWKAMERAARCGLAVECSCLSQDPLGIEVYEGVEGGVESEDVDDVLRGQLFCGETAISDQRKNVYGGLCEEIGHSVVIPNSDRIATGRVHCASI